eukprot:jgi/Chrzof1/6670/Cz19g05050.t1
MSAAVQQQSAEVVANQTTNWCYNHLILFGPAKLIDSLCRNEREGAGVVAAVLSVYPMSTRAAVKRWVQPDNKPEAQGSAYGAIKAAVVKDCDAALARGLALLEWYQEYCSRVEPAPAQALKVLVACIQCGQVSTEQVCGPCNQREWQLLEEDINQRGGWERHFPAAATVQQQEPHTPLAQAAADGNDAAATLQHEEHPASPLGEAATDGSLVHDLLPVTTLQQEELPESPLVRLPPMAAWMTRAKPPLCMRSPLSHQLQRVSMMAA